MNTPHNKDSTPLTPQELALWHAFKKLGDNVLSLVASDIERATGLSGADFGILSRLADLGQGKLTQADLLRSLDWQKSRLSHQLTRMEARGLIRRMQADGERNIMVELLPAGAAAIAEARPIHAAAVRQHLLRHIDQATAAALLNLARSMAQP